MRDGDVAGESLCLCCGGAERGHGVEDVWVPVVRGVVAEKHTLVRWGGWVVKARLLVSVCVECWLVGEMLLVVDRR